MEDSEDIEDLMPEQFKTAIEEQCIVISAKYAKEDRATGEYVYSGDVLPNAKPIGWCIGQNSFSTLEELLMHIDLNFPDAGIMIDVKEPEASEVVNLLCKMRAPSESAH